MAGAVSPLEAGAGDLYGSPMAHIADLLAAGPTLSFEFFPPRSEQAERQLEKALHELAPLAPSFVSVTYGAGGSTRERTRDLVVEINGEQRFPAMPHITCMGHTTAELEALVGEYREGGIENLLALAGDPPADGTPASGDFTYASELIDLIRAAGDFNVGVAAHPELHPRSPDRADDRRRLAQKLEAADFGITQFFFDADHYFRMIDELDALGCTTPVIPGVMPVLTPTSIARFADMANARRPTELWARYEALVHRPADLLDLAVEEAVALAQRLLDGGAPGLHLYALNRSEAVQRISAELGPGWRSPTVPGDGPAA